MQNVFLFISALFAYFIKGITGFGNTLVMGTLFSFMVSNRITTPVDLVFSIPINIFIVWRERKNISMKIVIPLSLMLLAGIIPGIFLLKAGSDWILKSILGIIIVGLAMEMIIRKPDKIKGRKANPVFLIIIGILSGVMAGLYGITALLVAYISRTTKSKSEFRGNICCVFLVDNLFRFFLYLYTGILNTKIFNMILFLAPGVFIGMLIGVKADSKMKEDTVKKFTAVMLMISGAVLCLKSVFFH